MVAEVLRQLLQRRPRSARRMGHALHSSPTIGAPNSEKIGRPIGCVLEKLMPFSQVAAFTAAGAKLTRTQSVFIQGKKIPVAVVSVEQPAFDANARPNDVSTKVDCVRNCCR